MATHTELPWEVWDGNRIVTANRPPRLVGEVTKRDSEETQANADFIALACNAHDELVAACEAALNWYQNADANMGQEGFPAGQIRTTLKKAGK